MKAPKLKAPTVIGGGIQKSKKARKAPQKIQLGDYQKAVQLQARLDFMMGKTVKTIIPPIQKVREKPPAKQLAPELQLQATGSHTTWQGIKSDKSKDAMDCGTYATKVQDMDICYERPSPPRAKTSNSKSRPVVRQNHAWSNLFPKLVEPLLAYTSSANGVAIKPSGDMKEVCLSARCHNKTQKVLCLYLDHCRTVSVTSCKCITTAEQLVANGLFPSAPQMPNLAFSIGLLEFYRALFEQSCDAISSMAAALYTFYQRRGFPITSTKGSRLQDPFRRGFTSAIHWYDALRVHIEQEVEQAISSKALTPEPEKPCINTPPEIVESYPITREADLKPQIPVHVQEPQLTPGRVHRLLRERCPACFGHSHWGRSLKNGGDIHVSVDGNFHHRHQAHAGDGPKVIDPTWLVPKAQVDDVGSRIEKARGNKPKEYERKVPDVAIDGCKESYAAAEGDKKKASTEKFDDHGLMFLVCRHDIPLFFANIDTPGEQQKYPIALLLHLLSFLPPQATASLLYDISCVLDRSLQLYDILPESMLRRLQFATSVMHAYGHQWACQLNYNPRMRLGMGLSDGEGVERLWSRLRKLIGVERSLWRSKRLWIIDRQASAIAEDLKNDLGQWLVRRSEHGVLGQGNDADNVLHDCKVPVSDLETEWADQVVAQSSVEAHAPARLKRGVDKVLSLHEELDAVESTITKMKGDMPEKKEERSKLQNLLNELAAGHQSLTAKVEELYSSLNLPDSIPQLKHANLDFVKTLILARDLKVNIRKRAIGSFFEWDKLDQASGGRGQALGTKLHQQTRQAISKRTPALITAVKTFNKYCLKLEKLQQSEVEKIHLPSPLPLKLAELREDAALMQDVWIAPLAEPQSRWLVDKNVRSGIRAMLKKQRCKEERLRLEVEARNLVAWYEEELRCIERALRDPAYTHLRTLLLQRYDRHLQLPSTWGSMYLPQRHFAKQEPSVLAQLQQVDPPKTIQLSAEDLDPAGQQPEEQPKPNILDPCEAILGDIISDDFETEDVDAIESCSEQISFSPGPPATLKEDLDPLDWEVPEKASTLVFPQQYKFFASDIARLRSPTGLLNDVCINDRATILQTILSGSPTHGSVANSCAILTTWELPLIRGGRGDDAVWRSTKKLCFWERDVWILPVHRSKHWVCCAIYPKERRISLFDSLGGQCQDDIRDAVTLAKLMLRLAKEKGFATDNLAIDEKWSSQQLVSDPLQHNEYDCGVWVLAFIISLLRGYDIPNISESVIPNLRGQIHETFNRMLFLGLAKLEVVKPAVKPLIK